LRPPHSAEAAVSAARRATESQLTGKTFAIVNQKGGVGKTTTAINLSAALASLGHRILLIDLDPQGNATSGVGVRRTDLRMSVYDVLVAGDPMFHIIQPSGVARLDIAPSDARLAGAEVELVPAIARETKLRNALRAVRDMYDAVFIDCPPSLGLLTINAMTAADACLIPMQCEYYALEGLSALLTTIDLIRRHLNADLRIAGVLLTMVDSRTNLSDQVAAEVRRHFGDRVCRTVVPRSVRLAEAPSHGQTALAYAPTSKGAAAYLSAARELAERIGLAARPETRPDEAAPEAVGELPGGLGDELTEAVGAASAESGGEPVND
jgi:chromosome partitioning protein